MKQWIITISGFGAVAIIGSLIYAAVTSPLVLLSLQVVLIAATAGLVVAVVLGLILAANYIAFKVQNWGIALNTARGQSVQFHSAGGQTYAANAGGVPIQPLHLSAPDDESLVDRWLVWTMRGGQGGNKVIELPASESPLELPAPAIPQVVRLEDIFDPNEATIRRLVLGAGAGGQVFSGHLKELSHIGIGGTSRWGKSIFMQVLLYQLLHAPENIQFFLSDMGGTTFEDFRIPYAETVDASEKMAQELISIYKARRAKFKATGQGVKTIDIYNEITGENLPYVVCLVDEATALMAQSKQLSGDLTELALMAAKYGIWLVLSGQNWKATNIETTIRDQFSSRFQFKAMDRYQSDILIRGSHADGINNRGRAMAYLPEAGVVEIQAPLLADETIRQARRRDVPRPEEPKRAEPAPKLPTDEERLVIDTYVELRDFEREKFSYNEVVRRLGWKQGGNQTDKVKGVLRRFGIEPM